MDSWNCFPNVRLDGCGIIPSKLVVGEEGDYESIRPCDHDA